MFEELKHLKALCKTLEDYENKCGDAEIDFVIDGKVYTPATFECNLDDRGNVWGTCNKSWIRGLNHGNNLLYSNFTCNCNKFTSVYYNIKYRKRICIALCSYSIN